MEVCVAKAFRIKFQPVAKYIASFSVQVMAEAI